MINIFVLVLQVSLNILNPLTTITFSQKNIFQTQQSPFDFNSCHNSLMCVFVPSGGFLGG